MQSLSKYINELEGWNDEGKIRLEVHSLTVGTEEDAVSVFSRQAFWLQGEPNER